MGEISILRSPSLRIEGDLLNNDDAPPYAEGRGEVDREQLPAFQGFDPEPAASIPDALAGGTIQPDFQQLEATRG